MQKVCRDTRQQVQRFAFSSLFAICLPLVSPLHSEAATFGFTNIGNDSDGNDLAQYLTMDVTRASDIGLGNGVLFQFKNDSANTFLSSAIRAIYFDTRVGSTDDTTRSQSSTFQAITGSRERRSLPGENDVVVTNLEIGNTIFSELNSEAQFSNGSLIFSIPTGSFRFNLPQASSLSPAFTDNLVLQRILIARPGATNTFNNTGAIQAGEALAVRFRAANFETIISSLENGDLRIGYQMEGGISNSYVNNNRIALPAQVPVPVPVPGLLLGSVVASVFGGVRLLKSNNKSSSKH